MKPLRRNSTEKIKLATGQIIHMPKCITTFRSWRGKAVKYTYGGKAVLDFRGKPLFAELVVLAMLKRENWKGVWVDSYRRKYRVGMFNTKEPIDLPTGEEQFLDRIRKRAGYGGCFDVFAWRGNKRRFIELKRRGKDHIRESQKCWLAAAIKCGVQMRDLLIVEWDLTQG